MDLGFLDKAACRCSPSCRLVVPSPLEDHWLLLAQRVIADPTLRYLWINLPGHQEPGYLPPDNVFRNATVFQEAVWAERSSFTGVVFEGNFNVETVARIKESGFKILALRFNLAELTTEDQINRLCSVLKNSQVNALFFEEINSSLDWMKLEKIAGSFASIKGLEKIDIDMAFLRPKSLFLVSQILQLNPDFKFYRYRFKKTLICEDFDFFPGKDEVSAVTLKDSRFYLQLQGLFANETCKDTLFRTCYWLLHKIPLFGFRITCSDTPEQSVLIKKIFDLASKLHRESISYLSLIEGSDDSYNEEIGGLLALFPKLEKLIFWTRTRKVESGVAGFASHNHLKQLILDIQDENLPFWQEAITHCKNISLINVYLSSRTYDAKGEHVRQFLIEISKLPLEYLKVGIEKLLAFDEEYSPYSEKVLESLFSCETLSVIDLRGVFRSSALKSLQLLSKSSSIEDFAITTNPAQLVADSEFEEAFVTLVRNNKTIRCLSVDIRFSFGDESKESLASKVMDAKSSLCSLDIRGSEVLKNWINSNKMAYIMQRKYEVVWSFWKMCNSRNATIFDKNCVAYFLEFASIDDIRKSFYYTRSFSQFDDWNQL